MMASESRDPTGDTGTGAEITDIGTQRLRTARDLVADVAEAETEIMAEAAVGEGETVQTPPPPPTKIDRKLGAADRTDAKEVGRRRQDDGLGGWGNIRGASHRRSQEKVGPAISAHRRRGNICGASHRLPQEKVGPAIGSHRTLVRPAIAALTVR